MNTVPEAFVQELKLTAIQGEGTWLEGLGGHRQHICGAYHLEVIISDGWQRERRVKDIFYAVKGDDEPTLGMPFAKDQNIDPSAARFMDVN